MEDLSESNISLRKRLEISIKDCREKKAEVEILNEENSHMHKTCMQLEHAIQMQARTEEKLEEQLKNLQAIQMEYDALKKHHNQCKTESEIEKMIEKTFMSFSHDAKKDGKEFTKTFTTLDSESSENKDLESCQLFRDIILKIAIVSKDLTEVIFTHSV